jgi:hypothetical protein
MNIIYHDIIGECMEVYIDDLVVKSASVEGHMNLLEKAFIRIKKHKLKMNPNKCAFGVKVDYFLGFLVHQKGIKVDKQGQRPSRG